VLQICENGILKLHTNLEIFASNPILNTHFFELGENVVCKKVIFYGIYIWSMKRHISDKLGLKEKVKKLSKRPISKRLLPRSGKFSRETPFFCIRYMGTITP